MAEARQQTFDVCQALTLPIVGHHKRPKPEVAIAFPIPSSSLIHVFLRRPSCRFQPFGIPYLPSNGYAMPAV
jgi:hypothetical protein